MGSWEVVQVSSPCLQEVSRPRGRRRPVEGDKSQRLLSEAGYVGMPQAAMAGQHRGLSGWRRGSRQAATRWDMAWGGVLDPTPHKDLGSLEPV